MCHFGTNLAGSRVTAPHSLRQRREQVRYLRSRPWRSRGPWFNTRAGSRRRGFRDDELVSVAYDDDPSDAISAGAREVAVIEDILLPDPATQPLPEGLLGAHVDLSGLQAIAAPEADPERAVPLDTIVAFGWPIGGSQRDDDSSVSRHSA